MLYIYYSNEEYEPDKHRLLGFYSDRSVGGKPEDTSSSLTNYSIIEIDERYNNAWYQLKERQARRAFLELPDEYYVNNAGQIVSDETGIVAVNPNPQKEAYKLSQLYGLTQQQLENYIDNSVTNLAEAKQFIKKLSAVVLWLVKQTRLDE